MYFNLKYIISGYIQSKYHYYLRCFSDEWRKASQLTTKIDDPESIVDRNFFDICEKGYRELVLSAIEKNSNNTKWVWGLRGACYSGNLEIVQLIIEKGVIKKDSYAWNWALENACLGGHLEIIQLMIEQGADDWNTGLRSACEGGHLEIVKYMIEKGANDWSGGLYDSCQSGNLEVVQLMIEKGAHDWNGGLYEACENGDLEIVKLMIEKGADNIYICIDNPDINLDIKQFLVDYLQSI